ncbi:MAG: hypothetical protein AVDCRST_MAG86-3242 [uncultured Truepera sp.]|uniref:HNH endonuclease 5 domain-containing protein n=1 Tax=uncultured Truepera sp. TaxID=543023 RepID=A0A6J4VKG0_9DEIN|nr:MAG: hypothetical protein AVDCRST_MAG86-3242 [uncultured Truepera sp.]
MRQSKDRKNNVGVCRLCLQERELRNSHIIPEFLYKPTYDDKHRANDISVDTSTVKFSQKGLRERLLCGGCEGQLSVVERYFANVWYDEAVIPRNLDGYKGDTFSVQVDYVKFKLFHLSILWRASISSLPYFSRVNLGPYEENLRQMVLTLNPGQEHQYGIKGWISLSYEMNVIDDLVHFPRKIKSGLYTIYICVYLVDVDGSTLLRAQPFKRLTT